RVPPSSLCSLSFLPSSFFTDPPTTAIYTLSLHDALPICSSASFHRNAGSVRSLEKISSRSVVPNTRPPISAYSSASRVFGTTDLDRKSTRLNSSHVKISYAVFCLKKKKKNNTDNCRRHST